MSYKELKEHLVKTEGVTKDSSYYHKKFGLYCDMMAGHTEKKGKE